MALMIPIAIAAYSYYRHKESFNGEPEFELEGKTALELMSSEKKHFLLGVPASSICFFDGNAKEAAIILEKRIDGILKQNPWLGGRLHVENGDLKLWYDESGQDMAPKIFCLDDAVSLSRDTPYIEYSEILSDVLVGYLKDIVEKDEPILKFTLIPDAKEPSKKFALVFSISRVAGDYYTFEKIHSMLSMDNPVVTLNPIRKPDFVQAAEKIMGREEASYLGNISSNPLWELTQAEKPAGHIFYVSQDWLRQQRLLLKLKLNRSSWKWVKNAKEKVAERSHTCCWGILPDSHIPSAVQDVPEPAASETNADSSAGVSSSSFSNHEMIVSWYWRTIDAKIALMACNMRRHLDVLTTEDAGFYQTTMPLTRKDYLYPELLHESRAQARRVGADRVLNRSALPKLGWDTTFSFTNDPLSDFGQLTGIGKQQVRLPIFHSKWLQAIPNTVSSLQVFTAGDNGELAVFLTATPSIHQLIESSGIVQETIAKF